MEDTIDSLPEKYKEDFNSGFNFLNLFPEEGRLVLDQLNEKQLGYESLNFNRGIFDGLSEGAKSLERDRLNEIRSIRNRNIDDKSPDLER